VLVPCRVPIPSDGAAAGILLWEPAVVGAADMSTNTTALATITITGRSSIGRLRIAAAPIPVVVRTRSAARARAIARPDSVGPWPIRALLRTRIRAARR
jgi:hypothetical protein